MSRISRVAVAAAVVAGVTIAGQQPALAACHAFEIAVSPGSVAEGGTVTVTVTRDAGVNPSSIEVSSVNETAQAGSDFPAVQRTISFTTETQQTFTVAITNDAAAEPAEAFRLHLSNPGGCPANPNFALGADARVIIPANDAAATTTTPPPPPPPTAPPTTPAGPGTTTATPEATTSTAEPSSTTTEPSSTTTGDTSDTSDTSDTTAVDGEALGDAAEDDGGSGGMVAAAAVVGVLALGGLGYLLYRRRSSPTG